MEVPCYCQTFLYHFPSWFRSWFFPNCSQRAWEVPWQPCSNGCLTSLQRQGGWSWQVLCTSSYHFHSWPIWMGKTSYDRKIGSLVDSFMTWLKLWWCFGGDSRFRRPIASWLALACGLESRLMLVTRCGLDEGGGVEDRLEWCGMGWLDSGMICWFEWVFFDF